MASFAFPSPPIRPLTPRQPHPHPSLAALRARAPSEPPLPTRQPASPYASAYGFDPPVDMPHLQFQFIE